MSSYQWKQNNDVVVTVPAKFIQLCSHGNLEAVQLFARSHNQELNMTQFSTMMDAFLESCTYGHLAIVQWLYDYYPSSRDAVDFNESFMCACSRGHLEVAQWLYEINPSINVHMWANNVFYHICANGHIDIGKWWISIADPNRDYHDYVTTACGFGHLELIQYISENYIVDFNVSYNKHVLYYGAYCYKYENILRWLIQMKPWVYTYVNGRYDLDEEKDTVEEKLWHSRKYSIWLSSDNAPNKQNIMYKLPTDISRLFTLSIA